MKNPVWKGRRVIFLYLLLLFSGIIYAQEPIALPRFINRLSLEFRPAYVLPTHPTLKGDDYYLSPVKKDISYHIQYALQLHPGTSAARIYGDAYQGIGLARYSFGNHERFGSPVAFYLFQGARLARMTPWLSFNYEWNFGISGGWHPYDYYENYDNQIIGSKINAYINANFYLNWSLPGPFDLTSGVTLTHFSNGNTKFPNCGLNTIGMKVGLVYKFNKHLENISKEVYQSPIPAFPRHISYDLVMFGSWRRKGVPFGDHEVPSPDAYPVVGFNFAPMYNLSYKFRAGVSVDGVLDRSANLLVDEEIWYNEQRFLKPSGLKQMALGISGRAEFVMPWLSVGIGLGANVLHSGGDMKFFYQILALKIEMTRNSFLHIGYSIHDFHEPNFLMLGIGYRFNNKNPLFYRR